MKKIMKNKINTTIVLVNVHYYCITFLRFKRKDGKAYQITQMLTNKPKINHYDSG